MGSAKFEMWQNVPQTIKDLQKYGFNTSKVLLENWEKPLADYLDLCQFSSLSRISSDTISRKVLAEVVASGSQATKLGLQVAEQIKREMLIKPSLQLGVHAHCLYDRSFFYSCLLHQIFANMMNIHALIGQSCATVHLLNNRAKLVGPNYLHHSYDVFKLFNRSKTVEGKAHVALVKNVKLIMEQVGRLAPRYANVKPPEMMEPFVGMCFSNVESAFIEINEVMWNNLTIPNKKPLLYYPEEFTLQILSRHISCGEGGLYKLLFDPTIRRLFLKLRDSLVLSNPRCLLSSATDFFLYADGESLRKVKLKNHAGRDYLFLSKDILCEFHPEQIMELMQEKKLFPDLILSYLILSVFPGVATLGGPSQCEYLPALLNLITETHKVENFLTEDEHDQSSSFCQSLLITDLLINRHIGHELVVHTLSERTSIAELQQELMSKPLGLLVGDGSQFSYLMTYVS